MARGLWGGWALLALVACAPSDAGKREAARDVVERFFTALPSRDCAGVGALLAVPASCPALMEDLHAQGLALVEVMEVRVDGREPDAVLVRTRVSRGGRVNEQPLLLRVEHHPDGWKLRW